MNNSFTLLSRTRFLPQRAQRIQSRLIHSSSVRSYHGAFSTTTDTRSTGRCFSSAPGQAKEEPELILYEKSPGHLALVRSGFGCSCFFSVYWVWYTFDFVPKINAAALTDLHIDPMIPAAGLFLTALVQTVFTGYPLRLVSKLAWRPSSHEFTVYTHTLPLVTPAPKPAVYAVGDVRLHPASVEARYLASKGNLQSYQGMLSIGKLDDFPPYLVDIRQTNEVKQPEILLELLLQPERISKDYISEHEPRMDQRKRSATKRKSRGRRRH